MRYTITGMYKKQYSTKQNDTFDKIALYFYGNETVASYLIAVNPEYSNTLIFNEGTLLYLPVLALNEASTLPQWKGGEANGL